MDERICAESEKDKAGGTMAGPPQQRRLGAVATPEGAAPSGLGAICPDRWVPSVRIAPLEVLRITAGLAAISTRSEAVTASASRPRRFDSDAGHSECGECATGEDGATRLEFGTTRLLMRTTATRPERPGEAEEVSAQAERFGAFVLTHIFRSIRFKSPACNHLYLRPPSSLHSMLLQIDTALLGELFRTAA